MAEGSQGAATSSGTGKIPVMKDKECPFCHQHFTSSSLGRHLDLYIRDKHPKPPDELHDVEEIRKLRGHITRRQARSGRLRHTSTPSSSKATPLPYSPSPIDPIGGHAESVNHDGKPQKTFVNQASWQATGVINGLPSISPKATSIGGPRRAWTGRAKAREEVSRRQELISVADEARAAELALKEVLESVKAANQQAHPSLPFEFNFFRLSLPQIYLHCLSPPPTLLAEPSRRPHELAWAVDVPNAEHCELVRGWLASKLFDWRRSREHASFGGSFPKNETNEHSHSGSTAEDTKKEESTYYAHLEEAFQAWRKLTNREREDSWHYECAKAFSREQEKHQETSRKLEQAEQEAQQLRARLDMITQFAPPPAASQYQSATIPLSREAVSHLPESTKWDYNSLVSKWRNRLRSARNTQLPLPNNDGNWTTLTTQGVEVNDHRPDSMLLHGDSWPSQDDDMDAQGEDEELVDAPAEVDSNQQGNLGEPSPHSRGVLNPGLRGGTMGRHCDGNRGRRSGALGF